MTSVGVSLGETAIYPGFQVCKSKIDPGLKLGKSGIEIIFRHQGVEIVNEHGGIPPDNSLGLRTWHA